MAAEGPGDHPGQPSHLDAESNPRGRGHTTSPGRLELKLECSTIWQYPALPVAPQKPFAGVKHAGKGASMAGTGLAWDSPSSFCKAAGPFGSGVLQKLSLGAGTQYLWSY